MDIQTAKYIINYFPNLLTDLERMAIRHSQSTYKLKGSENTNLIEIYRTKGWLTSDQSVLDLLKESYQQFELNTANRILSQNPDKVFFNYCPKCTKLSRTPYSRQCRFCGYNWHNLTVAQFKVRDFFQITGRGFFLSGQIVKGEIKVGQFIDLTIVGLNRKPKVEKIEFLLKREQNNIWEDVAIGTNELTKEDEEYLKSIGSFALPFDIINKR